MLKTRQIAYTLCLIGVLIAAYSCKEKQKNEDIIIQKVSQVKSNAPKKMQDFKHKEQVNWLGKTYTVAVSRTANETTGMIKADTGDKYYNNEVCVKVLRQDGTEFFSRTFTANDFAASLDKNYLNESVLLGVVLEKAEGDNLIFIASVGSPDALSDEYVPFTVRLSRMGNIQISKANNLEEAQNAEEAEEEGV